MTKLRDVVAVRGGGTPRRSTAEFYGGSIPWVTPKDMKRAIVSDSSVRLTQAGVDNSPAKLIASGSVLVVVRSGVLKHTLPVALTTAPVTVNQDMKALTPSAEVHPAFLARLVKSLQPRVLTWVRATTADNFPIESLLELDVEIPPLDEQRRIAAILDRADALRAKRREALAYLDGLAQSIFHEMFGEPDSEWPTVTVKDIASVKGGKRLPKGADYAAAPTPYPYVRVVDLKNGAISTADLRYLTSDVQATISRYTVASGDVVISIAGSIGLVAPVPDELVGANLTENAAKLVPHQKDLYEAEWLAAALRSAGLQSQIRSHVGQVTIGKLALFRIEKLSMILPPIEVQRRFMKRVRKAAALREVFDPCSREVEELFEALQASAFRGEL